MKKVLITGGAGFIGSNLARKLVGKGYDITIMDILSPQIHGNNVEESSLYRSVKDCCKIVRGDVRKLECWEQVLGGIDIIVHLAADTGTGQSMYQIAKYTDSNISGTAILLDILTNEKHSVQKLIVASSRAIYGEGKYCCLEHGIFYPDLRSDANMHNGIFNPLCPICTMPQKPMATDETSRICPSSVYGITKQVQEQLVLLFGKTTGIPVAAMRYQNVYGPGQSLKNPYTGILSIFSTAMLSNNDIDIYEDGNETRDFVYIDDVVNATILALENTKIVNSAINVGAGKPISVMYVAHALKDLYGSSSQLKITGRYRQGDIRHNYADLTLAKNILGYEPSVSFEDGLSGFVEWVKTQKHELDRYGDSMDELIKRGLYK